MGLRTKGELGIPMITQPLYLALSTGSGCGWGVAGSSLSAELGNRTTTVDVRRRLDLQGSRTIDGTVFHPICNHEFNTELDCWGKVNIGYGFFEFDFTPESRINAERYDLIFAGSTWC